MVKYDNGKIYKIWSSQTELIYIGSTTKLLCRRLADHKSNIKLYNDNRYGYNSSFEIIKYDDAKIELIENFSCNNKEELTKREGELIRQFKDVCVNMRIAGRTQQEYTQDNIEQITEYQKKYYDENKEQIKENNKLYREEHKEQQAEYRKVYAEENKEKLKEYHKKYREQKFKCECGSVISNDGKSKHFKSKKHQSFL